MANVRATIEGLPLILALKKSRSLPPILNQTLTGLEATRSQKTLMRKMTCADLPNEAYSARDYSTTLLESDTSHLPEVSTSDATSL